MSYDLSDQLNSKDSFIEKNQFVDGFTFNSNNERAAITATKLAADAVGTSSIEDLSITTVKIAGSAVTNIKLASSSVDGRVIANSAVGSTEIGGTQIQGTHIENYNYAVGTGNLNAGGGTFNSGVIGTPATTGGTMNSATFGTPNTLSGTMGTPTIIRPTIDGTANFDINAGSAALGANGDFSLQSFGTATVIAVRGGWTTFYFNPTGTI